jgi:hypothetical protein
MKNTNKQASVNPVRVIGIIVTIVFVVFFLVVTAIRVLFVDGSSLKGEANPRGQQLLNKLADQEVEQSRITAEAHGARWFSALSSGNTSDLVAETLPAAERQAELAKLEPYIGQKWKVNLPAKNVEIEGSLSYEFTLSADGSSKSGVPTTITIRVNGSSDRYNSTFIKWSASTR